ncbi:uncharacterized protein [Dysidea avara]|uniref:uncharacterized protein n=1 Tax=Dysidea avara TaxID=196820 RepID=UPI00331AEADB
MAEKFDRSQLDEYNSREVELYVDHYRRDPVIDEAFLFPAVQQFISEQIKDKTVVDIGCGLGYFTKCAADCDAKSVDAFDLSEEMVKAAKQATSDHSNVTVRVGDIRNMPYDDNSFEVALSIYITCSVRKDTFIAHYKELHRILVPGGKAMVMNFVKPAFDIMYLYQGENQGDTELKLQNVLAKLPNYPSNEQIMKEFQDLHSVMLVSFALDEQGRLYRITDASKLVDGQPIRINSEAMVFPDYYYGDNFIDDQIKAAGLCIDQIENCFTEERRIAYNSTNPSNRCNSTIVQYAPFLLYHLSKPVN